MRICIVAKNMWRGGAERVISYLIRYLNDKGHDLSLILVDDRPILFDIPEQCSVSVIGQKSSSALMDKILRYKEVRRLIKQSKCDIVLSMPEEIGIYVLAGMMGTKIPIVVSERNNPWVMPDRKISRMLRTLVYPFAKGLIFQTAYAASFFPKRQQNKGAVLPNPLDTKKLPPAYTGEREKVIAGAGRLESQKNFKLLIDAFAVFFAKHSDYQLIIYGEGSMRSELEAYAAEKLPADVFRFPGNVSDLPDRLQRVSAFVLSSDYEGMPNVLIEAMAMGVPCVATDCPSGGPKELIRHGENGFLCEVGNTEVMAQYLDRIIMEPEVRPDADEIRALLDSEKVCEQWYEYLSCVYRRSRNGDKS